MINILVCKGCEQRLSSASYALRHHSVAMDTAISVAQGDSVSAEEFERYREEVRASFQKAQAAWDAYRQHLAEHGFTE